MLRYNWQQKDWPHFQYEPLALEADLHTFLIRVGHVAGLLQGLPEEGRTELQLELMVAEAIKTSAIEGEYLGRKDVLSSIRKNLGLESEAGAGSSREAEGIGRMLIDVRKTYAAPLTADVLFEWHRLLFTNHRELLVGAWRTHPEPMQVVSGALGKEKVHFEAPPSERVVTEMNRFLVWFNNSAPWGAAPILSAPVRAGLAHLYFESIHPFEDGNGRIGRAIAEKALSQGLGRPVLLSLSRSIEADRATYYSLLSTAQRSGEVTPWLQWFVSLCAKAQAEAETQVLFTLQKARFFSRYGAGLNARQLATVKRMFEEGPGGFAGGMNAGKYGSLNRVSKPTATRDLQAMEAAGVLKVVGAGRSTRYELNL